LAQSTANGAQIGVMPKQRSQFRMFWSQVRKNRNAVIGGSIVLFVIAVALLSNWIAPYDPLEVAPKDRLEGPSWSHPMGTDKVGRDVLSRVIAGTPQSLSVGLISVVIGGGIGVTLGLIAGYARGKVSAAIVMLGDALLTFPSVLLALVVVAALGPGLKNTIIAIAVSTIPYYLRIVRAAVLSVRESQYVEAAIVSGSNGLRIVLRHILPNVLAPIIVLASLGVATGILVGSSLSFLGLGAQPPEPEWGAMLNDGRSILRLAPWVTTFPGLVIMFTVLGMNLLGDGLRDALDPRMKL
jgi:peptide/nickel transport system permease protein